MRHWYFPEYVESLQKINIIWMIMLTLNWSLQLKIKKLLLSIFYKQ